MKTWEEMSVLEQNAELYSDMYKDAYGFRPRIDTSNWTEEDFEKEFSFLSSMINEQNQERERAQSRAIEKFENRIQALMQHGARNREMAIRWLDEAYETNGDMEFLCYNLDLPYGYLNKSGVVA